MVLLGDQIQVAPDARIHGVVGKLQDGVTTVGQHHGEVAQHLAAVVGTDAQPPVGTPAKLAGQPQPVRQLGQHDSASVAHDPIAIAADFEPGPRIGSLHLQGDPPGLGMWSSDNRIFPGREGLLLPGVSQGNSHTKCRG
jgi:hypothetical protein